MSHYLDMATWKRREHFELFREAEQPFFSATVSVDVTRLTLAARSNGGPPFFIGALYVGLCAANAVPAMRLRMRGNRVRVHDAVRMSTTVMRADETYNYAVLEPRAQFDEFRESARAELERAKQSTELTLPEGDGIVYHSTMPWFHFTGFTTAIRGANSVPRVIYGKRYQEGERWKMSVAVEVHHAVADGLDVARFLDQLQKGFDAPLD